MNEFIEWALNELGTALVLAVIILPIWLRGREPKRKPMAVKRAKDVTSNFL